MLYLPEYRNMSKELIFSIVSLYNHYEAVKQTILKRFILTTAIIEVFRSEQFSMKSFLSNQTSIAFNIPNLH